MLNRNWAALAITANLGLGFALAACSSSSDDPAAINTPNTPMAQSELSRELNPQVADTDMVALADGNRAFAASLYEQVKSNSQDNLIFSPFSTSIALAMTYAGAKGNTESQMATALHFTLPQDKLHPAFNKVDLALAKISKAADPANGKGFKLRIANSLWGQQGFEFSSAFLDTLAVNYGAGLPLVDFQTNAEGARQSINSWVSQTTENKINELIPSGLLTGLTRLVLTNAIYFNASWKDAFSPASTTDATFNKLDGTTTTVKMMHQTEQMYYATGEGYQVVDLSYEGGAVAMTLLLPDAGRFTEIEGKLATGELNTVLSNHPSKLVALGLPKFQFRSGFSLSGALKALGMTDAFSSAADFSGLSPSGLFIQEVVHQAYIGVDEKGTEAAAATAVVMGADGGHNPDAPIEVVLDRPFLFFLRDFPTNTVLFAGRVLEPKN